jgi:hypothetical protein
MQNNKNYRTLYVVQILTIVILALVLITRLLAFAGLGPGAPHIYTVPGGGGGGGTSGGGYVSPSPSHVGMHTSAASGQAVLVIPPLNLR